MERVYITNIKIDKVRHLNNIDIPVDNKEMNILYAKIEEHKINPTSKLIIRTLKAILRRETAFAGFKRCYVREHIREFPELLEYIK